MFPFCEIKELQVSKFKNSALLLTLMGKIRENSFNTKWVFLIRQYVLTPFGIFELGNIFPLAEENNLRSRLDIISAIFAPLFLKKGVEIENRVINNVIF